jgi:hypothetical protein
MWQIIFDNDYQPDRIGRYSWPSARKWNASSGWKLEDWNRRFTLEAGRGTLDFMAKRSVFEPRYGYNVDTNGSNENIDICTDLKLSTVWVPQSPDAKLTLQLTSWDNLFFGDVSADGSCTLRIRNDKNPRAKTTPMGTPDLHKSLPQFQAGKAHRIALTHADLEVTLWVDGQPVLRSTPNEYEVTYRQLKDLLNRAVPEPQVKILAEGKQQLTHVQLMRDVYYTSPTIVEVKDGPYGDVARARSLRPRSDPGWGTTDNPITLAGGGNDRDLDEFFVMGDNSPFSLDSRCWTDAAPTLRVWKDPVKHYAAIDAGLKDDSDNVLYQLGTVPRYSMKGKAMFVYWPAGFRAFGWAIIPNVGRMRLIR